MTAGFLLDTNVISELMKPRPDPGVRQWIETLPEELFYLSVLTLGEIRKGIELLDDDDPKRAELQAWLNHDLRRRFGGRILAFDAGVAERWGQLEAATKKRRAVLPTIDAQLAATALHHGLTFATRNVSAVRGAGVAVFNPWNQSSKLVDQAEPSKRQTRRRRSSPP